MAETSQQNLAKNLDGKIVRDSILETAKAEIASFSTSPHLAIIQVGNLPESNSYIQSKKILGEKLGCLVTLQKFETNVTTSELVEKIKNLNSDKGIHGIIVQLPLPEHINVHEVIEAIDPKKDVDGLTSRNLAFLLEGTNTGHLPATARGIATLLDYYEIPIEGSRVVLVGRSKLVGKSTALVLLNRNATITMTHRKTKNLSEETKRADIIVVAAGHPGLITTAHVREGQTVIDVGITLVSENPKKFVGDVDPKVSEIVSALSPVPGGVGPMTVMSLFQNLIDAYKSQRKE